MDQYRAKTDRRSGITTDPNDPEDPEKIVRLVGLVVTVSLETVRIVRALPELKTSVLEELATGPDRQSIQYQTLSTRASPGAVRTTPGSEAR